MTRRTRKQNKRRGAIAVFAAGCLLMVVGFLALSVDWGYIVVTESELQNAADAGAMSGVRALADGREEAIAAAVLWTRKNIAAGQPVELVAEEDVEIGFWDSETATFTVVPEGSTDATNAVRVTCQRSGARGNPLRLFFAPILGTGSANLEASAIAQNKGGSCGGIMALNRVYLREESYTDSFNSDVGDYYDTGPGNNGDVCTNGHVRLIGTAGINGDAHPGPDEDGVDMKDSNYVTGDIAMLEEEIDFPSVDVGNAPFANDNDAVPLSSYGTDPLSDDGSLTLGGSSGKGKKDKKKGKDKKKKGDDDANSGGAGGVADEVLDLPPGTYYFTSLELNNGAQIRVTGETVIYVAGDVNLSDGGIVNETRIPMNLQIYPLGSEFWLPEEIDLHAVIYSTTSAIEKDGGGAGFFGKMVGQKIKINGTGGLHVDDAAVFGELQSGGEQLGTSVGATIVQ